MADIQHRPGRFELRVDGAVCELDYHLDQGRMVITHTGVAPALQGRGLAAELVVAGLTWARQEGHKVTPACSYVARFFERHPAWSDLL
jgi:predicted GNAT family acetyltransferase